jgi:hypothetical protein
MSTCTIYTCDVCRVEQPVADIEKSETFSGFFSLSMNGERKGYAYAWGRGIGRNRNGNRDLCHDCCLKVMKALGLDDDGVHPKDEETT